MEVDFGRADDFKRFLKRKMAGPAILNINISVKGKHL
jgi:hypothetical protein